MNAKKTQGARVLLCGATKGDLKTLFDRSDLVSSKVGRFDALFAALEKDVRVSEAAESLRNAKHAPTHVFLFALEDESDLRRSIVEDEGFVHGKDKQESPFQVRVIRKAWRGEVGEHLIAGWLPRASSTNDLCNNTSEISNESNRGRNDLDLLFVREWPLGVTQGDVDANEQAKEESAHGSSAIADAAALLRPRYLIALGGSIAFSRAPYRHEGSITRFIALGPVGTGPRRDWFRALSIGTATDEDTHATTSPFLQVSVDSNLPKWAQNTDEGLPEAAEWRWQGVDLAKRGREDRYGSHQQPRKLQRSNKNAVKEKSSRIFIRNLAYAATKEDIASHFSQCGKVRDVALLRGNDGKSRGLAHVTFEDEAAAETAVRDLDGIPFEGRKLFVEFATHPESRSLPPMSMGKPVEGCPFCLSNPSADLHLVVSVGDSSYVCMDKGPINNDHLLIIPIEHWPCLAAMPIELLQEMKRYEAALRNFAESQGKSLVMFERYMQFRKKGGNHCHINAILVEKSNLSNAAAIFEEHASKAGFTFEHELPAGWTQEDLRSVVLDMEYFSAVLPDGRALVHLIQRQERHPMNFGRDVVADLCGTPERGDWRQCGSDRSGEEKLADRFKESFRTFDIMN